MLSAPVLYASSSSFDLIIGSFVEMISNISVFEFVVIGASWGFLVVAAAGVHGDWVGPGGRAGATATGCSGSSASGPSDEGDAESSVQGFGCSGHVGRLASEEGPPSSPAYNRQQHYSLSSLGSHGGASGGSLGSAGPDSPRQADSWDDPTVAKWALAGGRAPRSNSVGFHVAANQYLYGSGLELGVVG